MSDGNAYRSVYSGPVGTHRDLDATCEPAAFVLEPTGPSLPQPTLAKIREGIITEFRSRAAGAHISFSSPQTVDGYRIAMDAAVQIVMTRMRD